MSSLGSHGRATAAALMVVLCIAVGCASPSAPTRGTVSPTPATGKIVSPPELKTPTESLLHYGMGVSLEARQQTDAALAEFEKSLQLDPTNGQLAGRLAQFYLARKDSEKAAAVLDAAMKANPSAPDPWLWRGIAARMGEDMTNAASAFQQALVLNPTYLLAIRSLAEVFLQQDNATGIVALFDKSFGQHSDDSAYWMGLGDLHAFLIKQKPTLGSKFPATRIRDCYAKAIALAPRDPDILLRVAESHMEANEYAAAAEAYTKLLKIRPDLAEIRSRLAQAYIRADKKEEAVALLKETIKREPLRFDLLNTLADLYTDLDKDAEAAACLQQSLTLNPNQFDAIVRLSLSFLHTKRFADALQTLTTARAKFPIRFQIPYLIGVAHVEQKQFDKAILAFADAEQLLRASDDDKPTTSFYFTYGAAAERAGQIDKAATLFRKSLELDPKNHQAANYLGYMWADKNQNLTEALDLIKRAVAAQPDNPAYLDSLGWAYHRLDRAEDALKELRRAITLMKEADATVYDHLAEVLHKLGRNDEAITALKQAVTLEPQNKDLADKLKVWTAK